MSESQRIDKWLWTVRLFHTRSQAAEACSKGHILVRELPVKPSHIVKAGDVVKVRRSPIYRHYRVLGQPLSRVGAKEVEKYLVEVTPQEELDFLRNQKETQWFTRDRGTGRPTKKERRELDELFNG